VPREECVAIVARLGYKEPMCGRFTLRAKPETIAAEFGVADVPSIEPCFNIAPADLVAVVRLNPTTGKRRLNWIQWGLVPRWAEGPAIGNGLINARAENAAEKPVYRSAFRTRRCLIAADGFYEWMQQDGRRQPYHIRRKDDRPFAFAGLWESRRSPVGAFESCAVITGEPNELVRPIHGRMPVILRRQDYHRWLDPAVTDAAMLKELLVPYPAAEMVAYAVSTLVNAPDNDRPECVRPLVGPGLPPTVKDAAAFFADDRIGVPDAH
jgi:putative SOS response-associated peptidase YedK